MKRITLALGIVLGLSAARALAVGSLADVTIYDRSSGRLLPTYQSEGRWYVAGRPGNEYEIRIRNQSGTDVLAVTSVDGINVVTGESAVLVQSGYVLSNGRQLQIKGWRKDMTRVAAFYFTSLDDSYAARTGRPHNVGVIGVALFKRKLEPPVFLEQRSKLRASPESEAARDAQSGRADSAEPPATPGPGAQAPSVPAEKSLGTGHGRSETSHARYTSFERESDRPNEVIAIYYDSYANLVDRGIILDAAPRDPQPFPARFVPDPPGRW
jgi:hypothetical protein